MNLEKAIHHARLNPITPVGRNSISRFAAVMSDGTTEIVGWNSYKTHPLQARFASNSESIHCHAEITAIKNTIQFLSRRRGLSYRDVTDLSEWSMAVARVLKNGDSALAQPCVGCQRALSTFGVKDIQWTI